jgi:tRNA-specific 2-thiouridylase
MMKIAVAVSGGVDSMVTAHLLKSSAHDIFAIHFLTGYETADNHDHLLSPYFKSLGVKLITINLSTQFQSEIVNYFISTYASGKTPNPCIKCNADIKFGYLRAYAMKLGADKIATGHYAQVKHTESGLQLLKGIDRRKDQSYFLGRLSPRQLASAIFPLGEWNKETVINYAIDKGIDKLVQPESQEACFIRDRYQDFLIQSGCIKKQAGPVITTSGKEIGHHNGLHEFTIGQRRGINCPGPYPYYVVRLEQHTNTLVVGKKDDLLSESCLIHDINWIVDPPKFAIDIDVRIRYRTKAVKAKLTPTHLKQAILHFDTKQSAVTPGQVAVFYQGDTVCGGGIIQQVLDI